MKRLLLLITLSFSLVSAHAQDHKQSITDALKDYTMLIQKQDYRQAMEYINPAIFEIMPKESMIAAFESMHNSPAIDFSFGDFSIVEVSEIFSHEGTEYASIKYNMSMDMTMHDATEESLPIMLGALKMKYGEEKVELLEGTKTFRLETLNSMIGTHLDGGWRFIENKPEMQLVMDKVLPTAVQQAFTPGGK